MGVLGSCLRSIGSFDESLKYLNKAIELDPNYSEALINRGLIYLNKKDKANALTDLEKAHKLKPHINQIWHLVLGLKMEVNDFENTISLAAEMVKLDPVDEKIFATIAICYQHLHNYDDAVVFYKKAISINPDYAEVYYNMGLALQEQGRLEDAIHAFTKALAINPDNPKAYSNRGLALQKQDKLDDAIEDYTKAISMKPDYAEAYSNMGNAFQRQGKLDDAIEAFNKALSINPDDPRYWNNLFFPLQALKAQVGFNEDLSYLHPKDSGSNYGKIALSILNCKIHRGKECERIYLTKRYKNLSKDKNGTIFNPKSNDRSGEQTHLSDKMVALVHFGRSGTGLMHSLIDGHPEVSMLPMYFSEYFDRSTWEKIISAGWDGMVDRFIEIYDVLFDALPPSRLQIVKQS